MTKLIILDFDNTIYNYDFVNNIAIESILNYCALTYNMNYDEIKNTYSSSKKYINDKFKNTALSHDKQLQIKIFVDTLFTSNKINITNHLSDMYYNTFISNVAPYDNLYTFLDLCKSNNIKVVILTNNMLDIQLKIWKKLNLDNYIDNLYSSYEIGYEKPNSNAFDYVVKKYNYDKNEIVMIGDSQCADYNGAFEYGINAILFTNYNDIIKYDEYTKFKN